MKVRAFEKEIVSKFGKIKDLFRQVNIHFGTRDIRSFRIEVKKVSALLALASCRDDSNIARAIPEKLDTFYNLTGQIRSAQLQQMRISHALKKRHSLHPEKYLASLQNKLNNAVGLAKRYGQKKKSIKISVPVNFTHSMDKNGKNEIEEFVRQKHNQIERLITPFFPSDSTLHELRKVLKEIIHTWAFVEPHFSESLSFSVFTDKNDVKSICKKLGSFQNKCASLALLQEFNPASETRKKGRVFLKQIESDWKKEKELARTEIAAFFFKRIVSHQEIPLLCEENGNSKVPHESWVVQ